MGLAGQKFKQRIGADPNNKAWKNNTQSVGFKLMSQMGWSGSGLGANESGMVNNIQVVMKQDNLGIGANIKTHENWLENSSAFDDLLAGLQTSDTVVVSKVEETRELHVGRHYHRQKFMRNKQVSNYDAARLDEILGKKSEPAVALIVEKEAELRKDDLLIVKNVSVQDYFLQKMNALKASSSGTTAETLIDSTVESTRDIKKAKKSKRSRDEESEPLQKKKKSKKDKSSRSEAEIDGSSKSKKHKKSKKE